MKKQNKTWEGQIEYALQDLMPPRIEQEVYKIMLSIFKQEILSVLDEMRMEKVEGAEGDAKRFNYDESWYVGYNQAVEELNAKIEEIKKRYE